MDKSGSGVAGTPSHAGRMGVYSGAPSGLGCWEGRDNGRSMGFLYLWELLLLDSELDRVLVGLGSCGSERTLRARRRCDRFGGIYAIGFGKQGQSDHQQSD